LAQIADGRRDHSSEIVLIPGRWEGTPPAGCDAGPTWRLEYFCRAGAEAGAEHLAGDPVADAFELTSFGTMGKVGTLKPGIDPAIILSPNFLAAARQLWGPLNDVGLLLASALDVRFMEAGNIA